ncbi:hypothetical protein [Streptomyces sp. NRRL F-5193]|uniref:hypothetical protein n=1 Tax=Streptomyces sp. NRRL F-5193 TaxID=1463860 RepID=UPI00131BBE58|nr:hypothetical protein [Streptomyces sp. NRRL F-5193]
MVALRRRWTQEALGDLRELSVGCLREAPLHTFARGTLVDRGVPQSTRACVSVVCACWSPGPGRDVAQQAAKRHLAPSIVIRR